MTNSTTKLYVHTHNRVNGWIEDLEERATDESGEIASWLILAAALVGAALVVAPKLKKFIEEKGDAIY